MISVIKKYNDVITIYKLKIVLFLLIIVSSIVLSFILPFRFILNFAQDDSFFYLKTAQNFVNGSGLTFDGINSTNGFHPLYFFIISLLFFFVNLFHTATPEFLFRTVFLLHLIMILSIVTINTKIISDINLHLNRNKTNLLLVVILFVLVFIRDFGLESHIGILIIAFYLSIRVKEIRSEKRFIVVKSICIILLFLTRIDYIFTIIPAMIFAEIVLSDEKKIKTLIIYFVSIIPVIVIYLSINYYFFNHYASISSMILNSFPQIQFLNNLEKLIYFNEKLFNQFARLVFFIFIIIFYLLIHSKKPNIKSIKFKFETNLVIICAGCFMWALINLAYNVHGLREWYLTTPVFIASLLLVILISNKKSLFYLTLIISLIIAVYVFYNTRLINLKFNSNYEYANILKSNLKPDDKIFQIDFCGIIGFFSERKLVNGDGLINSYEYYQYLKDHKIDDYLKKYNVNYYSTFSDKIIKQNDSIFCDIKYLNLYNNFNFCFLVSDLVLRLPFQWNHIAFSSSGEYYLFKISY